MPDPTLVTNSLRILAVLAEDPDARLVAIGEATGLTDRAVHRLIVELERCGYVTRSRSGKRNRYALDSRRIAGELAPFEQFLSAHMRPSKASSVPLAALDREADTASEAG